MRDVRDKEACKGGLAAIDEENRLVGEGAPGRAVRVFGVAAVTGGVAFPLLVCLIGLPGGF